jgi:hypothetical protein
VSHFGLQRGQRFDALRPFAWNGEPLDQLPGNLLRFVLASEILGKEGFIGRGIGD